MLQAQKIKEHRQTSDSVAYTSSMQCREGRDSRHWAYYAITPFVYACCTSGRCKAKRPKLEAWRTESRGEWYTLTYGKEAARSLITSCKCEEQQTPIVFRGCVVATHVVSCIFDTQKVRITSPALILFIVHLGLSMAMPTTSSAIAERPRDALSQLKSCQLLHNCTKYHIWLQGLPFHVI